MCVCGGGGHGSRRVSGVWPGRWQGACLCIAAMAHEGHACVVWCASASASSAVCRCDSPPPLSARGQTRAMTHGQRCNAAVHALQGSRKYSRRDQQSCCARGRVKPSKKRFVPGEAGDSGLYGRLPSSSSGPEPLIQFTVLFGAGLLAVLSSSSGRLSCSGCGAPTWPPSSADAMALEPSNSQRLD